MRPMEMRSISATIVSVISVSGTFRKIMEASTLTIVTTLEISCVSDWEIIWRRVSMSLVYTLMISPWACVSKYLTGRRSIFS